MSVENMTHEERHKLADDLNEAWAELRILPVGGRGHLLDVYLTAARAIRPPEDN